MIEIKSEEIHWVVYPVERDLASPGGDTEEGEVESYLTHCTVRLVFSVVNTLHLTHFTGPY